ncbi:hypothetical protein [Helicobacter sp. MIT 01-3238]|uniref:hypothetical protein n=1 Tax=Helicobacter sp. MIT 01-3238 TaxID=398627 RepID=UPI0015F1A79A|nr:hypothetical protein [Helicobacter sp. MIT 01-3238]
MDCYESDKSNSSNDGWWIASLWLKPLPRNDEFFRVFTNAKDTHPQTPSAEGGGF